MAEGRVLRSPLWLAVLGASVVFWGSPAASARADSEAAVNDPFEAVNRGIFWFNDTIDRYLLEHLAQGFDYLLPDALQRGIRNAFENGRLPIKFTNNLLQLKFGSAAGEIVRFGINTMVGIGGLFDAAADGGLPSNPEDFGQTLGYWGVSQGPFLMVPLLGPSNVRDGFGLAVDSANQLYSFFIPLAVSASLTVGDLANIRALSIDVIRENRASAFDLYAFTRNAYVANRRYKVLDRDQPDGADTTDSLPGDPYDREEDEDLYFFDDEREE